MWIREYNFLIYSVDGVDLNGTKVEWTKDLADIPKVTDGDVFAYLCSHCK